MKCRGCLSEDTYEQKRIRHSLEFGGRTVIFENVPALVCTQCGETLFSAETAEVMQRAAAGGQPPSRTEQVPVYDLAEVA